MSSNDILKMIVVVILIIIGVKLIRRIFDYILSPIIIKKTTKEIEKNPTWITSRIKDQYYGFSNIDIIVAESSIDALPRFRLVRNKNDEKRLEFLIPSDTSIRDLDQIATLALRAKLHIFYDIFIPDKPAYWLSILCYMLDGGDIQQIEKEEKRQETN